MRYQRRISLGKHIKLNISKNGISTSFKIGGLTINPQRDKITYKSPIKGLSFTQKLSNFFEYDPMKKDFENLKNVLIKQTGDCFKDIDNFIRTCHECNIQNDKIYNLAYQVRDAFEWNNKQLKDDKLTTSSKAKNNNYIKTLAQLKKTCKAHGHMDESVFKMLDIQSSTLKSVNKSIDLKNEYIKKIQKL